jgi:hypothetical protein
MKLGLSGRCRLVHSDGLYAAELREFYCTNNVNNVELNTKHQIKQFLSLRSLAYSPAGYHACKKYFLAFLVSFVVLCLKVIFLNCQQKFILKIHSLEHRESKNYFIFIFLA